MISVHLFKASKSLKLFGFETHFESMKIYANGLIQQGESLKYGRRDLGWLFK